MTSVFPAITGIISGFNQEHQRYRDEQLDLERERNRRESEVYTTLMQHGTPEMQHLALTGLLTSATGPQRKGGLRGWIGDMQTSPIAGQIRDLINTPETQTQSTTTLPSRSITGVAPMTPGTAGQVSTQTTRAGQPPPLATAPDQTPTIPSSVGQPPPMNLQIGPLQPGVTRTTTTQTPRKALLTPEEQVAQHYRGEYSGEIEGITQALVASGLSPQEAAATARDHFLRSRGVGAAGGLQLVHGKDAQGKDVSGMFDKRPGSPTYGQVVRIGTDEPIPGFVQTSTGQPRPTDRWQISQQVAQDFGEDPAHLSSAAIEEVNRRVVALGGEKAGASATGRQTALAGAPLSREQATTQIREFTEQWNHNTAPIRAAQMAQAKLHAGLSRLDTDPNGAAQDILTAFDSIINPQTGVGSSEYARSAQGQPLLDRAMALWQRYGAGGGQGVTKENLQDLAVTADAIVQSLEPWRQTFRGQIEAQARAAGITDTGPIFGEPSAAVGTSPPIAPSVALKVGTSPTGRSQAVYDPATKTWIIK